jgi:hypothetical protein
MCYHLRTIYNKNPLFPMVDATYVIHLKGNGRYQDLETQLDQYPFTKNVHVIINEGYKKCSKTNIDSPAKDLVDAYLYCFKHAKKYENILILEDDFIVNTNIYQHTDNINSFIQSHKNFIYRLGCGPCFMVPYDKNNYKGFSTGTHAVIYSKSVCNQILKYDREKIKEWDIFLNFLVFNYIYYAPIVYQLFPQTENQKSWGDHNIFWKLGSYIVIFIIKILRLDKQIEPGYSILYWFAKLWWVILICILIFFTINTFKNNNK